MSADNKQRRLFFALWPDDDVRESLTNLNLEIARQCTGIPMRANNLHLTLAFIGNVAADKLNCLLPMAEEIFFKPFVFKLEHLGVFVSSKVIWVGLENEPPALMRLAAELHRGALGCGIPMDKRAFNPHLTLLRKAEHLPELTIKPIDWQANDFCLVAAVRKPEGVEYQVLYRWP